MSLNLGISDWLDRIDPIQDPAKARELLEHRKAVRAEGLEPPQGRDQLENGLYLCAAPRMDAPGFALLSTLLNSSSPPPEEQAMTEARSLLCGQRVSPAMRPPPTVGCTSAAARPVPTHPDDQGWLIPRTTAGACEFTWKN